MKFAQIMKNFAGKRFLQTCLSSLTFALNCLNTRIVVILVKVILLRLLRPSFKVCSVEEIYFVISTLRLLVPIIRENDARNTVIVCGSSLVEKESIQRGANP